MVLAILGILATVVTLSVSVDTRRDAAGEAERLALLLEAASQEAQWGGRTMAWSAGGSGYKFFRVGSDGRWDPIVVDELFRPRSLNGGLVVSGIEVEGRPLAQGALLIFSSAHTPLFRVALNSEHGAWQLRSLPSGRVELQRPATP